MLQIVLFFALQFVRFPYSDVSECMIVNTYFGTVIAIAYLYVSFGAGYHTRYVHDLKCHNIVRNWCCVGAKFIHFV